VTSPPYFALRDYDAAGQIGLEDTPPAYVEALVGVFREVRRVLKDDGILWLNLGDGYNNFRVEMGPGQAVHGRDRLNGKPDVKSRRRGWNGLKEKDLFGIPWRVAFALQDDGWYLRQDNVWSKPNPMPESMKDRTTRAHEYVFMLTKAPFYYYDADAIREPGRNRRSVWTVETGSYPGVHYATMPEELVTICVLAGSRAGDTVLDPFGGTGTTGAVASRLGRDAVLIDLNPDYCAIAKRRCAGVPAALPFWMISVVAVTGTSPSSFTDTVAGGSVSVDCEAPVVRSTVAARFPEPRFTVVLSLAMKVVPVTP